MRRGADASWLLATLLPSICAVTPPGGSSPLTESVAAAEDPSVLLKAEGLWSQLLRSNETGLDRAPWVWRGNEIVFGMLSGNEVLRERALPKLQTWCVDAKHACVVFSDQHDTVVKPWVLDLQGMGFNRSYLDSQDSYVLAQKRFIPALRVLQTMLNVNYRGKFSWTKWAMLVDDDTYVYFDGLMHTLSAYPDAWTNRIYTGDVCPKQWLPMTATEGHMGHPGQHVTVKDWTPFVLGGGGSVFSIAALKSMELNGCVAETLPGGKWGEYQSDWMLGTCAARHGIRVTQLANANHPFNQFVCTDPELKQIRYCFVNSTERTTNWDYIEVDKVLAAVDGQSTAGMMPATLHPIKDNTTTWYVRQAIARATAHPEEGMLAAFRYVMGQHFDVERFMDRSYVANAMRMRASAAAGGVSALSVPPGVEAMSAFRYCDQCPVAMTHGVAVQVPSGARAEA